MTLLQGKTAFVTGGASGIGKAACLAFAREGAAVCVVDRDSHGADAVAEHIRAAGGRASSHRADVSSEAEIRHALDVAEGALGPVHCYFNNAGIGTVETNSRRKRLADIALEDWTRMLSVNLTGVFLCLKHQLPRLKSGGSIVNTASIAGLTALQGAAAYVASKHGVIGLTRSAAIEYGSEGVRVNAVCPGHIETPLLGVVQASDELAQRNPMKRYGTAEEIADLVVWLSSDQATFVNGATFTADGGRLAGG
jgi:NAD(P)-dependent dehydrogenase (short-subunit alcohol dehydrogenase family)